MQIYHAKKEDIPQIKKIWMEIFEDSKNFTDFAVSICPEEGIYLLKDEEKIVAMTIAGIDVEAYGKKGFYIYGVGTIPEYRKKGCAKHLINYICDEKFKNGYDFSITQPATESLFDFYKSLGFDNTTYLRKFSYDIKRSIWESADFDTVTSGRFNTVRKKFAEDEIVSFTDKGYVKFTEYVYTEGGSTAENKDGYCLYFEEKNKIIVRDMFAKNTNSAIKLLQAIRERTGKEKADIELSQNSTLFLGEGKLYPHCVVKNLDKEVYANLMFD